MKVSAACEQTRSLTWCGVSAQDRSHFCCQLMSLDQRAQKILYFHLPDNYGGQDRCESLFPPCPHLPATSSLPQESPGARRSGRQRMPQRALENSHEAAGLREPEIQRARPVLGAAEPEHRALVTACPQSRSACRRRHEPASPEDAFCTGSPRAGEEGQREQAGALMGRGCPKPVGALGYSALTGFSSRRPRRWGVLCPRCGSSAEGH